MLIKNITIVCVFSVVAGSSGCYYSLAKHMPASKIWTAEYTDLRAKTVKKESEINQLKIEAEMLKLRMEVEKLKQEHLKTQALFLELFKSRGNRSPKNAPHTTF